MLGFMPSNAIHDLFDFPSHSERLSNQFTRSLPRTFRFLVVIFLSLAGPASARAEQATAPMEQRTYAWRAQFVALDETTKIVTLKAQIPAHVEQYVGRFKPGDRLILVWDMVGKKEADRVLALWEDQTDHKWGRTGYVLPVEFAGADLPAHVVMFRARVPDAVLKSLTSMKSGEWMRVVSPMAQPSQDAKVTSIEHAPGGVGTGS